MHILIATTGVLPPVPSADLCRQLLSTPSDDVTVMTVIEVPRTFLESMDEDERRSFLDQGDWETETAELKTLSYLEERGRRAVEPLVSALRSHEIDPHVTFVEGQDPVDAIVTTALDLAADIVMMGATRRLFTEQAWMSVSARVMERTHCPLVLVPASRSEEADRDDA